MHRRWVLKHVEVLHRRDGNRRLAAVLIDPLHLQGLVSPERFFVVVVQIFSDVVIVVVVRRELLHQIAVLEVAVLVEFALIG